MSLRTATELYLWLYSLNLKFSDRIREDKCYSADKQKDYSRLLGKSFHVRPTNAVMQTL